MELTLRNSSPSAMRQTNCFRTRINFRPSFQRAFTAEFAFMLDDAILNGTGVGQPLGIMNSACLVTVTRNTANEVNSEDIVGMWARCISPSSATWLCNADVFPQLLQMGLPVSTAGGMLTYMPPTGLSGQPFGTLLEDQSCKRNNARRSAPRVILFWQISRMDTFWPIKERRNLPQASIFDSSMMKPASGQFTAVDGQPILNAPIVPFKGSTNTISHFVALS